MWEKIARVSSGHSSGMRRPDMVAVSTVLTSHSSTGQPSRGLSISVGQDAMREMRWVIGDRVVVLIDRQTRRFLVQRTPDGESTITPGDGTTAARAGQLIRGRISRCIPPELVDEIGPYHHVPWEATADGLILDYAGRVA